MRKGISLLLAASILAVAGCQVRPGSLQSPADLSRIAGWKGQAPNSTEAFRFVVLSDRTGGHEQGAWKRVVTEVNRLQPDFVMCVGDLVEGYVEDAEELRRQWEEFDAITQGLDAPFFYCPGNHDVQGVAPREVYTDLHGRGSKTFYSFDYRSCHFVVLDTTATTGGVREIARAQWEWLKTDLAAARGAKHTFIFAHHPLWKTGTGRALLVRLVDAKRTTVFCGHWHAQSYGVEFGVPCFVLGPSAVRVLEPDRQAGTFQLFAHVTVDGAKVSICLVPVGEILPPDLVHRQAPPPDQP